MRRYRTVLPKKALKPSLARYVVFFFCYRWPFQCLDNRRFVRGTPAHSLQQWWRYTTYIALGSGTRLRLNMRALSGNIRRNIRVDIAP